MWQVERDMSGGRGPTFVRLRHEMLEKMVAARSCGHLEGTVSARENPSAQTKMKQHPPLHHPTWRVPDAVRGKERTPVNDAGECGTVRRPASVITG